MSRRRITGNIALSPFARILGRARESLNPWRLRRVDARQTMRGFEPFAGKA